MRTVSEVAIKECVAELEAACRRPIDPVALDTMVSWMRPSFERILDRTDGGRRWAEHGQRMRENSRHLGMLADFFGSHSGQALVGLEELTPAVAMMKADCTTKAERTAFAWQYCKDAPVNSIAAEQFLRTVAPLPELALPELATRAS